MKSIIQELLSLSEAIRYVAIYRDGELDSKQREAVENSSSTDSDKYEELLVNPTLLTLAKQRGDIDCGGLNYLLVRYGNFFQLVIPRDWGHVSVCIEQRADPIDLAQSIQNIVQSWKEKT